MSSSPVLNVSRAASLRQHTQGTHRRLDAAINAQGIFGERARFGRFLQMQYRFHADIAPLYLRADLGGYFEQLPMRGRLAAVAADLRDLGMALPATPSPAGPMPPLPLATALGWLYVAEGSALGAALILKLAAPLGLDAGFGASHLAPAREGVAMRWRRFIAQLDAIALPPHDEDEVIAGAHAAFDRVHGHMTESFKLP